MISSSGFLMAACLVAARAFIVVREIDELRMHPHNATLLDRTTISSGRTSTLPGESSNLLFETSTLGVTDISTFGVDDTATLRNETSTLGYETSTLRATATFGADDTATLRNETSTLGNETSTLRVSDSPAWRTDVFHSITKRSVFGTIWDIITWPIFFVYDIIAWPFRKIYYRYFWTPNLADIDAQVAAIAATAA